MIARLIATLTLLAATTPAVAEERITSFVSDVRVEANGTLDVVETISLVSDGDQIQRGIQRDFPTRYPGHNGGSVTVGFDVVDVARDGHAEPYKIIGMDNGERVRIGDADTLLPHGDHVYRIHYRTTRQIGFFKTYDELYWNATGTGWTFPIEQAEARITLPRPAQFGQRAFYTGAQGATSKDAAVVTDQPGQIIFRTTKRLEASQGLTVAAAWPKGIVSEPGWARRLGWALRENGPMWLAIAGLLTIIGHVARTLWRVKRNPDRRPMVPLFAPPDSLSAAALRLIWRMGFDDRTFSAAIVDTGVRGRLRIVDVPNGRGKPSRTLEKIDGTGKLPPAEEKMVGTLFKGQRTIALKQSNHDILGKARSALADELDSRYGDGQNFSEAPKQGFHGWKLLGCVMVLLGLVLALAGGSLSPLVPLGVVVAIVAGFAGLKLLSRLRKHIAADRRWRRGLSWVATALLYLILFHLLGAAIMLGFSSQNPLPLAIPLIGIPFLIVASLNLRGPTPEGWAMRDRILGFRHYLSITEEDRLEKLNPPEKTAALFERYLPYAIALGVENRWAKRFSAVLAAAAATEQGMTWYSGTADPWRDAGSFTSSVGSALSSTIASASSAPGSSSSGGSSSSSSSGSSGGGSSGGGGGGGGGSGW